MMCSLSKKWAVIFVSALFLSQVIATFHTRPVNAATEQDSCATCRLSKDLNQWDAEPRLEPVTAEEKGTRKIEGVDFLEPQQIRDRRMPWAPQFPISI